MILKQKTIAKSFKIKIEKSNCDEISRKILLTEISRKRFTTQDSHTEIIEKDV